METVVLDSFNIADMDKESFFDQKYEKQICWNLEILLLRFKFFGW